MPGVSVSSLSPSLSLKLEDFKSRCHHYERRALRESHYRDIMTYSAKFIKNTEDLELLWLSGSFLMVTYIFHRFCRKIMVFYKHNYNDQTALRNISGNKQHTPAINIRRRCRLTELDLSRVTTSSCARDIPYLTAPPANHQHIPISHLSIITTFQSLANRRHIPSPPEGAASAR